MAYIDKTITFEWYWIYHFVSWWLKKKVETNASWPVLEVCLILTAWQVSSILTIFHLKRFFNIIYTSFFKYFNVRYIDHIPIIFSSIDVRYRNSDTAL